MEKISDSAKFTEVYHLIMKAGEAFSRLSPNIPKALLEVQQHIHGSLGESAYHVFKASNTFDNTDKVRHLTVAQEDIFFLYNRIYKGGREFADPYKAYESIATRKGMFQRYHGLHVARRWFDSLDEDIRKDIRMNSDTSVIWLGDKPSYRQKLISLEE